MKDGGRNERVCLNSAEIDSALRGRAEFEDDKALRRAIAGCLGPKITENTVSQRFRRGYRWWPADAAKIAALCGLSDFNSIIDHERNTALRVLAGQKVAHKRPAGQPSSVTQEEMLTLYDSFGQGDFVGVFSFDGFLENENHDLLKKVVEAVQKGMRISYFFPEGATGEMARGSFEEVYAKLVKRLGANISRVRAYLVDPNYGVCAHSSRFVVLGKVETDHKIQANSLLVYIDTHGGHWFYLDAPARKNFVAALEDAIDPLPYVPMISLSAGWTLPTLIQEVYHGWFSRNPHDYAEIREILDTKLSAQRVGEHAVTHLDSANFPRQTRTVRWLDIGAEDGINTGVTYKALLDGQFPLIALTGVDPSRQRKLAHPILDYSPFFNGPRWTFEAFDAELPAGKRYDVITCLHSFYLISPVYLVRAYRRLSSDGVMILTLGPLAERGLTEKSGLLHGGNFINAICGVIDLHIAAQEGDKSEHFEFKAAQADPYRVYAEDVYAALAGLLGLEHSDIEAEVTPGSVDKLLLVANGELTDLGKMVIRFFCHGIPISDENRLFSDCHAALSCLAGEDGKLPATEIDFVISKSRVASKLSRSIAFRAA